MSYNELDLDDLQEELLAIDVTLGGDLLTSLKAEPEVFEKFVANCYEQNQTGAKNYLPEAFSWNDAPEGFYFWSALSDKFFDERMARLRGQKYDY